uniref:Gypsy retrotransposon integrase-like protein 1 n=1 Tax=Poecilia reticulata TaxID=8081 RepID=A0A3P9PE55_POERE
MFKALHGHSLAGHFDAVKTLQCAQARCYWPYMSRDITEWCLECVACEARRPPTPCQQAPLKHVVVSKPFEKIAMDFTELPLTTYGNRYMLVVMDYFTKYINLYVLPDQRAVTVAKCLFEDYICRHGVPHSLHTDQGRQFDSDLIKCLCLSMGVHKTRTSPYHSMSNGMVERANRSIKDQLAKYLYSKGGEWDVHMKQVEFAYNTCVHSTTNFTPIFLVHGREARLPADLFLSAPTNNEQTPTCAPNEYATSLLNKLCSAFDTAAANMAATAIQQKHHYDRQVRHEAYDPGDLVWVDIPSLSRHKLAPRWTGPFKVLKRLDFEVDMGVDYEVLDQLDPRAKPKVVCYNRLKPYRSPVPRSSVTDAPPCTGPPTLTALSGSRPWTFEYSSMATPDLAHVTQSRGQSEGNIPTVVAGPVQFQPQ